MNDRAANAWKAYAKALEKRAVTSDAFDDYCREEGNGGARAEEFMRAWEAVCDAVDAAKQQLIDMGAYE